MQLPIISVTISVMMLGKTLSSSFKIHKSEWIHHWTSYVHPEYSTILMFLKHLLHIAHNGRGNLNAEHSYSELSFLANHDWSNCLLHYGVQSTHKRFCSYIPAIKCSVNNFPTKQRLFEILHTLLTFLLYLVISTMLSVYYVVNTWWLISRRLKHNTAWLYY